VTVFTVELPWLKGRDLDLVMGEALCSSVGWPLRLSAAIGGDATMKNFGISVTRPAPQGACQTLC
jgi:hypothetical protein